MAMDLNGIELREGYAEVGDAKLHYVEAGKGPRFVLLHRASASLGCWRSDQLLVEDAALVVATPTCAARTVQVAEVKDSTRRTSTPHPGLFESATSWFVGHVAQAWACRVSNWKSSTQTAILDQGDLEAASRSAPQIVVLLLLRPPGLPGGVVRANDWHFFRHFLQDASRNTRPRISSATSRHGRRRVWRPE